jgi:hypothetical protein
MRNWIAVGIVIALVADLALFFGIGFGLGALSIAGSPAGFSYHSTPYTVGGGGMSWYVEVTSYTQAGSIPTTEITNQPGSTSSVITFALAMSSPNPSNCGNSNQPVWAPGLDADTGYWSLSLGGTAFVVVAENGTQFASSSGTVNLPITSGLFYCLSGQAGQAVGDAVSPSLNQGNGSYYSESITIVGQVADGTALEISLEGEGTYCGGSTGPGPGTVCYIAANQAGSGYGSSAEGGFQISANAYITTESGQSSIQVDNTGDLGYNGGPLTISAQTGFAGSSTTGGAGTYSICVLYPPARGGGCDGAFPAQTVPSDDGDYSHTWTIPQGTSVNSTTVGWNNFYVQLSTSQYIVGQVKASIDIGPAYQPLLPFISVSNTGTFTSPQVGNTETITILANASAHSGPVTSILVWVFYISGSGNPSTLPACGSAWVPSVPCPAGYAISVNGNHTVGAFQFTVAPPPGSQSIVVWVDSENGGAQVSPTRILLINIVPNSCTPGQPGCSTVAGETLWEELGPILLVLAFVLVSLLVAVFVPSPWIRYLVPAVVVGIGIVLIVFGFLSPLFSPGGALDTG